MLIYQNFLSETGSDYNFASAVSVIAIVLTGAVFLFQKFVTRKVSFPIYSVNPISRKKPRESVVVPMWECFVLTIVAPTIGFPFGSTTVPDTV